MNNKAELDEESLIPLFQEPYKVVGVAVSPARLEALKLFLESMIATSGLSFLIISQVDVSILMEHIAKRTNLNVVEASDSMEMKPDHIYMLPSDKQLSIVSDRLFLKDIAPFSVKSSPVDRLFVTLAECYGNKAISIIFSGAEADCRLGINAIRHVDGIVMFEGDADSKSVRMSASDLNADWSDYRVSPQEMPQFIIDYVFFYKNNIRESIEEEQNHFFSILKQATGVDFSCYKQASILRRIHRRMGIHGMYLLQEYNQFLCENPAEITALQKDLLIGVTHFFRDHDAFQIIANKVIPTIFQQHEHSKQIRIWVAGCSTGEEVYSLAILFQQYNQEHRKEVDVKIFATDLDKDSIDYASKGVYPEYISKNVTHGLLKRFFTHRDNEYHVNTEIRKMIIFAQHNILNDPPFIQLDLVTCRNLLIYLQPEMQRKVISLLHFSLKTNAFLFLGPSETLGKLTNMFKPVDSKWNIYQYKEINQWFPTHSFGANESLSNKTVKHKDKVVARLKETEHMIKLDNIYTKLIEEYVSACIIVDEHNEIIHINGNASKYLIIPNGKPSHNLFKMIPDQLSVAVGTALHKVRKEQKEVIYLNIHLNNPKIGHSINLITKPFNVHTENDKLAIIFFEEVEEDLVGPEQEADSQAIKQIFNLESNTNQHIKDLELQLLHAKESLQATIEELETSNEEFQAANEELIVANEELQSSNEELQSMNEQLRAINREYQNKIQELSELNNDMSNFFVNTDIATIFLDMNKNIRKFTPAATKEINLMEFDVGRPISDISHQFKYELLLVDVSSVLLTSVPVEKEIQSKNGSWFIIRISPYLTASNLNDGVVITFVDITELKKINDELTILSYAIQQSPGAIVITDIYRKINYVNTKFTEQTGYTLEEVLHTKLELYSDQLSYDQVQEIWTLVATGKKWVGELLNKHKHGGSFYEMVTLLPITNDSGEITHLLKLSENIMEQKHALELLHKSEMLSVVGQLAAGVAHEIRNPLTSLKGFTKLLEPSTEKKQYIQIMTSELDRIETIISELLILARPQKLHFENKDVLVILQDVLMLLEPQAVLNNVEFLTKFATSVPLVNCIQNQLKQVFINIVKNGIEAMPHGGNMIIKVKVIKDHSILISFTDEGIGIPKSKIPKLGDPFYTTKENGTGLGLTVSYKIIENHQGKIEFKSILGKRTTVNIILKTVKSG